MAELPVVCTLAPEALIARREGLLLDLLDLTGPRGTHAFVEALLDG